MLMMSPGTRVLSLIFLTATLGMLIASSSVSLRSVKVTAAVMGVRSANQHL